MMVFSAVVIATIILVIITPKPVKSVPSMSAILAIVAIVTFSMGAFFFINIFNVISDNWNLWGIFLGVINFIAGLVMMMIALISFYDFATTSFKRR